MNKHYCGQRLQDFSFYIQVNGCNGAHKAAKPKNGCTKHTTPKEKDCCKDESEYLKMDTDWQINPFEFKNFTLDLPLQIVIRPNLAYLFSKDWVKPDYLFYKPPLIADSFQVLFQSFRC